VERVRDSYLSVNEAASLLGLSKDSIRRAVRLGRVRVLQLSPGGAIRIPMSEITSRLTPWSERAAVG